MVLRTTHSKQQSNLSHSTSSSDEVYFSGDLVYFAGQMLKSVLSLDTSYIPLEMPLIFFLYWMKKHYIWYIRKHGVDKLLSSTVTEYFTIMKNNH